METGSVTHLVGCDCLNGTPQGVPFFYAVGMVYTLQHLLWVVLCANYLEWLRQGVRGVLVSIEMGNRPFQSLHSHTRTLGHTTQSYKKYCNILHSYKGTVIN